MVAVLRGADSAVPRPALYPSFEVWGVYRAGHTPHVWTDAEIGALGHGGVKGCLPIVVPPTPDPTHAISEWWKLDETGGYVVLEQLVREANVPAGAPLALDIEESLAEMIALSAPTVAKAWVAACAAHRNTPWIYAGESFHQRAGAQGNLKWLANWAATVPASPQLPGGFHAWQYAGNQHGGQIDLDVFEAGRTYLGTNMKPVTIGETTAPTAHEETAMTDVPTETTAPVEDAPAEAPAAEPAIEEAPEQRDPVTGAPIVPEPVVEPEPAPAEVPPAAEPEAPAAPEMVEVRDPVTGAPVQVPAAAAPAAQQNPTQMAQVPPSTAPAAPADPEPSFLRKIGDAFHTLADRLES